MTVTTKFNIGDKVWINGVNQVTKKGGCVKVEIFIIRIMAEGKIDYVLCPNHYAHIRLERFCYKTKAEALSSRKKENEIINEENEE